MEIYIRSGREGYRIVRGKALFLEDIYLRRDLGWHIRPTYYKTKREAIQKMKEKFPNAVLDHKQPLEGYETVYNVKENH